MAATGGNNFLKIFPHPFIRQLQKVEKLVDRGARLCRDRRSVGAGPRTAGVAFGRGRGAEGRCGGAAALPAPERVRRRKGWTRWVEWAGDQRVAVGAIIVKLK